MILLKDSRESPRLLLGLSVEYFGEWRCCLPRWRRLKEGQVWRELFPGGVEEGIGLNKNIHIRYNISMWHHMVVSRRIFFSFESQHVGEAEDH